jgi:4-carboxymuconolactone decarboxylase
MKITKGFLIGKFGADMGGKLAMLFSRKIISARQKKLCSIACLQAIGDRHGLTRMLEMALSDTKDIKPVYETLLQGYLFCGYPRAIESFFCLDEVLKQKGISLGRVKARPLDRSTVLMNQGRLTAQAVHGDKFRRIHNKISAISPDLGYLMIAEGYGHVLSRGGLDLRSRELAIISCLAGLGALRQLNSHIRGAMNTGCSSNQALEAIFLAYPWVGIEEILKAADVWEAITGKEVNPSFRRIIGYEENS